LEVDLIFRVAGIGIIVAVLHQLLHRAERTDQAMVVSIAGLIVVLVMVIEQVGTLFETVRGIFNL